MTSIVLIRQPERKKLTHNSNHVNYFIPLSKPTWNWFRQRTRVGQHRGRVYQINILLLKQERGPKIWISKMMKIQYPNQKNHNSQTKNWFSHQNPHKSLVPPQLTHLILPLPTSLKSQMNCFHQMYYLTPLILLQQQKR